MQNKTNILAKIPSSASKHLQPLPLLANYGSMILQKSFKAVVKYWYLYIRLVCHKV